MDKDEIMKIDRKHIWHPFTQMKDYADFEHIPIHSAEGIFLYDEDGNRYYDTIASWWTNTHGHKHPKIMQAIRDQLYNLDHVNFSGFTHRYAADVVKEMTGFMDTSLNRYFFSDDGSTAMEVSLKIAYQYWRNIGREEKSKFVHLSDSYHGDTVGSLSLGGNEVYHVHYRGLMFESYQVDTPIPLHMKEKPKDFTYDAADTTASEEGFEKIASLLREKHAEIAGVVLEPLLMGAAGMQVYAPVYLQKLRALTKELDILLIYDEVVTGFGRTGEMFAYQKANAVPDIVGFAKGLTGGMLPMALTVVTEKIYQAFYDDYLTYKTFFHGHSYTANPIACAAASANLRLFKEKNFSKLQKQNIKEFHKQVRRFANKDYTDDIRYLGWAAAVDIVKERGEHPYDGTAFKPETRLGLKIYQESMRNGLVLRPLGDTIYWLLPLIATKEDVKEIISRSMNVIERVVADARDEESRQGETQK